MAETCERDWREHEEFFSKKISVLRQRNARERVLRLIQLLYFLRDEGYDTVTVGNSALDGQ